MTYLKKISIEHYKGFFEEQSLEFGIPDNERDGSGLTVITGPNNTGKTTLMEALLIGEHSKKFYDEDRHENQNSIIKFLLSDDSEIIYSNHHGGAHVHVQGNKTLKIAPIFSRRHRNVESTISTNEEWYFNQSANRGNIRENLSQDLIPLLKIIDGSMRDEFDPMLKMILPNITGWSIGSTHHGDYIKYITSSDITHSSSSLGDGVLSIFVICANLVASQNRNLIIIDEPELSLHPQAQKRLAKVISQVSKDKQIIICTHSPYFVNRKDLINGTKFVRLNKIDDKKCTIHCLGNSVDYSITEGAIHDWHKPYTLEDIAAKEIMFSEKILFVEGQDDVGLIIKYCDGNFEINFDIFGYGAGGRGRFKSFLKMARDLGLKKVGVLYDGDVPEYEVNNIRTEFERYEIKKLSTDDIRDKDPIYNQNGTERVPRKTGLFDQSGNIKSDKKDEFDGIINGFIQYFS